MSHIKGINKPQLYIKNPLFTIPTGDDVPNEVNMLVEAPKGSFNKYEYNTYTGLIKLDRVLYQFMPYPVEYGAIPQTWDEDEDMLDIMSLSSHPTFSGCLISIRPIGVMYFIDSGEIDDKIIGVPADDIRFAHINDIKDLPAHSLDEIHFFFQYYKELQFKYKGVKEGAKARIKIDGWKGKEDASRTIQEAVERYKKKFADTIKEVEAAVL